MQIVIGSGPAGVAAASALLARGQRVLLLDAGLELEPERRALRERLRAGGPGDWAPDDVAALRRRARPQAGGPSGLMRPFGSDFHVRDPSSLFGPAGAPHAIELRPSFAAGGLSSGWGASVLPYRQQDLDGWPITADDLAPHYAAIRSFVPIAATQDDLAALFPAFAVGEDSGLAPSTQATRLLERLGGQREALRLAGMHFGRSRVAVDAPGCRRCRMCLHGCPYGVIYEASATLAALRTHADLAYRRGWLATRFEETADGVRVLGRSLDDGRELEAYGARLFVAGGVLPTARLVLGSLERFDRPLTLKDSQHFYLPMLQRGSPSPDPAREALHTLTQAFVEIVDDEIDRHTVHVQLYTHNDFYADDMRRRFGPLAPLAAPLIALLSRRLVVAQAFLHSDVSPSMQLALVRDAGGERLDVGWHDNPAAGPTVQRVRRRLAETMRAAGLVALLPLTRLGGVGSSFHCGGTFPMRAAPGELECDVLGRPAGLSRVHLVDASVFPSIPATTITLSVMANAHRIASEAGR